MKMSKVTVEIEVPPALRGTGLEEKFLFAAHRVIEERAVIRLFEEGDVFSGSAAELLELTKYEFFDLLKSYRVPFFNLPDEEWEREMETIVKFNRASGGKETATGDLPVCSSRRTPPL